MRNHFAVFHPNFISRPARHLVFLSLLSILFTVSARAQNIQNPQSAVDNLTRSSMHVDPSTGALQFQIPLGEYRGRGEASLPVVLHYSSKLWNIKHLSTLPCNGEPVSSYYADYAKSSAAGWTSSVGWFLPTQDLSMETYEGQTQQPATQGNPYLWRIMRMFVTLPDGSRHELRRDDGLHDLGESLNGVYYAVDGSRLWYDTATDTLFMPNGSRVVNYKFGLVIGNPPTQYIDRNGNLLTFNTGSSTWTDTLGRSIGVPFGGTAPAAGNYTYTLPGGLSYPCAGATWVTFSLIRRSHCITRATRPPATVLLVVPSRTPCLVRWTPSAKF